MGAHITENGFVFSAFPIAMLLSPMVLGKISDKYGERVPISIVFTWLCVGSTILLNAARFVLFALAFAIFGLGVGFLSPAYSSLISKVVP